MSGSIAGLVSTPDARRLRGGSGPRGGAQCFHRRLGDAGVFRSLAAGLEHQSAPFVHGLLKEGLSVQRQRAEEGPVRAGRPLRSAGRPRKQIGFDGVDDGPHRGTLAA